MRFVNNSLRMYCVKGLKWISVVVFLFVFMQGEGYSQTVIGGLTPDTSALLDLQSTNRGFLLPRMTKRERDSIPFPATGLMIFNISSQCLEVNFGIPEVPSWKSVECGDGFITLQCDSAVWSGELIEGVPSFNVSVEIPYTSEQKLPYAEQSFFSEGVTGLSAMLNNGEFSAGGSSLTLSIEGTPDSTGVAFFEVSIGGKTCELSVDVSPSISGPDTCGAYIAPNLWQKFLCHNLGSANVSHNPENPSWVINGGYWQWGRQGPNQTEWLNSNSAFYAHGPIGELTSQSNDGGISGWSSDDASSDAWQDGQKTNFDPCPEGFRIPSKSEWDGVVQNNDKTQVGTWAESSTNYSSGQKFGPSLFLPAAGYRYFSGGWLIFRGIEGRYWSSTEGSYLHFDQNETSTKSSSVRYGYSIRCISEQSLGQIGSLNCDQLQLSTELIEGVAYADETLTIPYNNGNGGVFEQQVLNSLGVQGLTAVLDSGYLSSGNGNLDLTLSGTPEGFGTATFELSIGGQICTLEVSVKSAGPAADTCGAYISDGIWKGFMCHNLGAANLEADPFTPSWEIIGGYWQWGREGLDTSIWKSQNSTVFAHGPIGPLENQANSGAISNWQTNTPASTSWNENEKTIADPCPIGYRIPHSWELDSVINNNPLNSIGTWVSEVTNYGSGLFFGPNLMLPAAGYRSQSNGMLSSRGSIGTYWSSAYETRLNFLLGNAQISSTLNSNYGLSIRCISEDTPPAQLQNLECDGVSVPFRLEENIEVDRLPGGIPYYSTNSIEINYSGGNKGWYDEQTISSVGVTGLTAFLEDGSLTDSSGTLHLKLSGTPNSAGAASFNLTIAGKSCTINVPVNPIATYSCGAFISSGEWKILMCHNLASNDISADPFTPNWRIIGGYWEWDKKGPDPSVWLNTNTNNYAHGPTSFSEHNAGKMGMDHNYSWSVGWSAANDPCPSGYRVPSGSEWAGIRSNNSHTKVGSWSSSATNYSSGSFFGSKLFLPAAGYRHARGGTNDGLLISRGAVGIYPSRNSECNGCQTFTALYFTNSKLQVDWYWDSQEANHKANGFSIRCIKQ